ncbi:unnamed protein product [Rotaria sp. Silwood1]|nr:unnamed protein product [Rotaria sp. Silwood1]
MLLIIMAAALIIGITICYLRSITIALMIITGTALSLGTGCFVYNIIYRIPIFPFLNLMSAFILIGIGCDDIFVFFDRWDQEKLEWLRKYQNKLLAENILLNSTNTYDDIPSNQQENPNKLKRSSSHDLSLFKHPEEIRKVLLSEEALIEIMSNTLKHAGSSMFVTSFTTSAAFLTNILTNISFIQVFGIFVGTCVLIYFAITFTAIAAFAVIYEKHIQNIISHVLSMCCTNFVNKAVNSATAKLYHRFSSACRDFRNYIFGHFMPLIIIKLRYVSVLIFLLMGILGLIGSFYYPKLKVPSTQKTALFLKDNPMEIYEFSMKSQFNGYLKEDKRLFTYPAISFVFGIRDIDDGYIFDMNDRGRLHLMPLYLNRQITLEFFKNFIKHLGTRKDLFLSNYDLEEDFKLFYELATDDILVAKVINDRIKLNVSKTGHLNMIKYIRKINKTFIDNLISDTVRTINYKIENDQSDHDGYVEKKLDQINLTLYKISNKQLKNRLNPVIIYSNYRKSFNRTLERIYKEQIQSNYDVNETRISLNNTLLDALTDEYQCSALKTAMQCITGVAGADNVPMDFCNRILTKQRSFNWVVLPDKPSPIDGSVRPFAVLITIRGVHNRTDYNSYNKYYMKVKNFFDPYIKQHAPEHLKHAWFSSSNFAFYGVQRELLSGSSSSLLVSLGIALVVLFLTSGNLFIAVYALITITFAIAITVGVFVVLEWELGIIEGIVIVMAVGLSVDFVVHFGVGYIHTDSTDIDNERKKVEDQSKPNGNEDDSEINTWRVMYRKQQVERATRVRGSILRVGSAVFMAAFTTFAAGFSMIFASVIAIRQMGQFLMAIMLTSWGFAMFFFLPLCLIIGPVGTCGSISFSRIIKCFKKTPRQQ